MNYNYIFLGLLGAVSFVTLSNIMFKVVSFFSLSEDVKKATELKHIFVLLLFQLLIVTLCYYVYKEGPGAVKQGVYVALKFVLGNKRWFIFAVGASALGFITMGLPGFGILALNERVTAILNELFTTLSLKSFTAKNHGDSTWPTAIMISILWPWGVFLVSKAYEALFHFSTEFSSVVLSVITVFTLLVFFL